MKLPHRLLIVVGLALAPISALQIYSAFRLEEQQTLATFAEARRLLQLIEDEQASTIAGIRRILVTIRQAPVVLDQNWTRCRAMMGRLTKEYSPSLDVYVTDQSGTIECSTEPLAIGINVSTRQHVKEAFAGNEFFIGGQLQPRTKRRPALPFSVPYQDAESGAVLGAVTALLDLGWLDDYLAAKPLPTSYTFTTADRNGLIIAQVPKVVAVVGTKLPGRLMELFNRNTRDIERFVDDDGVEKLVVYSPLHAGQEGLFLALTIDDTVNLHQIRKDRNLALLMLLIPTALNHFQ